ncbi:MAG TPA: SCO family protein [Bryobacteraceae bacterium]|nr:SCO family protein [Bryobacteraceae bacterium]
MKKCTLLLLVSAAVAAAQPRIPETSVVDQDGRKLSFYSDLVKGRTVAINFIFTSCATICPMLAANFRKVQQEIGETNSGFRLISVSVDPGTDTPERLKRFAAQYHAGPNWTLVTGDKAAIDGLLGALGLPVRNKIEHTPAVLVGNEAAGYWQRVDGLASSAVVAGALRDAAARSADNSVAAQSARYFPNLELLTQDGAKVHFHDDLLKGKTVLINFLFTTCTGVCSPMTANLARVQKLLGDRVGRDIVMISITVDPEKDTPAVLKAYAEKFGAKPGWYFLTGTKANVDGVLGKLGGYVSDKNQHSSVVLIGNVEHGGWQKMLAVGDPPAIAKVALQLAR